MSKTKWSGIEHTQLQLTPPRNGGIRREGEEKNVIKNGEKKEGKNREGMDIEIVGRHALLFDDDTTAAFVNSQDALVDWNSLLIDRYDVRHLLFSPPPSRRRRNPQTSHSTSADVEIDYERYLDLPSPSEEEEADPKPEPVGGFNAVPFSYGNNEESNDQKNAEAESEVPAFHPPFPVPESLVQNLPPTEKAHQIISRTALFVSKNGGQSEIVLRVKQGDNPTFGFLMPDHHLHPYFRFLVNHKDLLQSNEEKASNTENPTGALSLLGSVYGTGEDDDNGTEHPSSPSGKDDVASWKTKTTILPAGKDEPVSKQSLDAPILKKNSFPNVMKAGKTSSMRKGESSTSSSVSGIRASSLPPIPKTELMVMDPPSDMKKLVDKIVEFIIKNGRQFEGVLIEQDRGHGRFPFLIPNNIFHPYYLKVLHTAHESKSTVGSFHNEKGNSSNKKMLNSRDTKASLMESDDIPLDSDRKEKFKMVMNKSKKEASDPPSKPTQEQSVQVDAAQAAAILQAATRGIKHPNLGILNGKFGGQQQQSSSNVNETDSNEQKLKAERLKRAKMFVAMLKSGTNPSKAEPTRGLSAEPQVSIDTSDKKIKSEKEHLDDEKRSKRKYRDRSSIHNDIDDDEGEEKRSHRHHKKKKHRSHESEERHRSHHSTSHKHDDVDKNNNKKDHKRKKKHRSSSSSDGEDEHEYEHSRRKHRSHKSSSHKHRKSRSRSSRHKHKHTHDDGKASNSEEGEMSSKRGHVSREASVDVSSSSYQEQKPQPSQITEVPDDLRAKIRAMLMSTM
ncbi:unnamed protein product [Lactuca virosa]|uniref:SURP motif domain-containing protein n=1 Tax=Lactuca virosa TaxID=75947 RepID=A0AAU9PHE4_9ASTR|nr:unnamed protein product [Lactuca virosa]